MANEEERIPEGGIWISAQHRAPRPPPAVAPPLRYPVVRWWRLGRGGWLLGLLADAVGRLSPLRRAVDQGEAERGP